MVGMGGTLAPQDGSAYLEQGNTKVLAAVYGPHEVRARGAARNADNVIVNCQYSMAVFSTGERKRRPRGDRKSQEMSMHLRQTFEVGLAFGDKPKKKKLFLNHQLILS